MDGNRTRWARLEAAKRRLIYGLDSLGLPYGSAADGFDPPLAFAFKADVIPAEGLWRTMGEGERVYTGHADGKITINIREADDAEREKLRVDFGEAHRTLIGHFRHEIGHYYWDLLVREPARRTPSRRCSATTRSRPMTRRCRSITTTGRRPDWPRTYVSAYATMHPWEDWAETFALYLAMAAMLDTAYHLRLVDAAPSGDLATMLDRYRALGLVLNEISREMGLLDLAPAVITEAIAAKLGFVHDMVGGARGAGLTRAVPAAWSSLPSAGLPGKVAAWYVPCEGGPTAMERKPNEGWNFVALLVQGVARRVANELTSEKLVLPFLYTALGGSLIFVGLFTPVVTVARLVAQLLGARLVEVTTRGNVLIGLAVAFTGSSSSSSPPARAACRSRSCRSSS